MTPSFKVPLFLSEQAQTFLAELLEANLDNLSLQDFLNLPTLLDKLQIGGEAEDS